MQLRHCLYQDMSKRAVMMHLIRGDDLKSAQWWKAVCAVNVTKWNSMKFIIIYHVISIGKQTTLFLMCFADLHPFTDHVCGMWAAFKVIHELIFYLDLLLTCTRLPETGTHCNRKNSRFVQRPQKRSRGNQLIHILHNQFHIVQQRKMIRYKSQSYRLRVRAKKTTPNENLRTLDSQGKAANACFNDAE